MWRVVGCPRSIRLTLLYPYLLTPEMLLVGAPIIGALWAAFYRLVR